MTTYGHTPTGYRVNPYEPARHCQACSAHRNERHMLGRRFCGEKCRDAYDRRRRSRSYDGDGDDTPTRPRTGGLIGF